MRSYQAEAMLQARGYLHVSSIGGIDRYDGAREEYNTNAQRTGTDKEEKERWRKRQQKRSY